MINLETRNRNWDFNSEEDIKDFIFQNFIKPYRDSGATTISIRVRDICMKMGRFTPKMFLTVFNILNSKDYHQTCAIQLDQKYKVYSINEEEFQKRVNDKCRKWDFDFSFKINFTIKEVFYIALKDILSIQIILMVFNLYAGTLYYWVEIKYYFHINSILLIIIALFTFGPLIILLSSMFFFHIKKLGGKNSHYFCLFTANFSVLIFHVIFLYPDTLFQIIVFIVILFLFFGIPNPKKAIIPSVFLNLKLVFLEEKRELHNLIKGYTGILGICSVSILSGILGTFSIYPLFGYFSILLIFIYQYHLNHIIQLRKMNGPRNYNSWLSRLKNFSTILIILALINFFSQLAYLKFSGW